MVRLCTERPEVAEIAEDDDDLDPSEIARRIDVFRPRAAAVIKCLRPYLVALLPNDYAVGRAMPDAIGSGILVRSVQSVFVVTAAHVWETLASVNEIRIGDAVFAAGQVYPIALARDIATLRLPFGEGMLSIGAREYKYEDIVRAERYYTTMTVGFPVSGGASTTQAGGSGLRLSPALLISVPHHFDKHNQWFESESAAWTGFRTDEPSSNLLEDPDLAGMSGGPAFQECEGGLHLVGIHTARGGNDEDPRYVFSPIWNLLPDGQLT